MNIALNQPATNLSHTTLRARVNGWILALVLGASIGVAGVGIALPKFAITHAGATTTHQIATETGGPMN